jgi:hypothetical protein
MSVRDKSIEYPLQMKMKWWYWPLLILAVVTAVGSIIWSIAL